MTTIRLDGKTVKARETLFAEIGRQVKLPAHFGNNLDALYDFLATDLTGPAEIYWDNYSLYRANELKAMAEVRSLLEDVAAERPEIKLIFN